MDAYSLGQAAVLLARSRGEKQAADAPESVYALKGKLMLSSTGWILLSVPNAFARGAFDALAEPGTELPPGADGKPFNAHISVIRPEEMEEHNIDPEQIVERGHEFTYTTTDIKTVVPAGWGAMSKVWFLEVKSPALENLRKSYGLSARPKNNQFQFHISFAVRKRNVLRENDIAVGRVSQSLIHKPSLFPDEFQRQKAAAATHGTVLGHLRQAKMHSDRRDYTSKHQVLKHVLQSHPHEFEVDNPAGKYHGLTHKPSGFKIHAPAWLVPSSMKTAEFYTRAELQEAGRQATKPKSPEQAEAGNYQKGHIHTHGLSITIENGKGQTRSGVSKAGKAWSVKMKSHYGYIRGTVGIDKDHIDVFIGPDPHSELVFIINQVDEKGKPDEHKVMLGFANEAAARTGYLENYEDGWKGLGSLHALTLAQFKTWLASGDTKKPYAVEKQAGVYDDRLKALLERRDPDRIEPPIAVPDKWWSLAQLLDKCGIQEKEAALLPGVQPLQPQQQAIADMGNDPVRMLLYHSLGSGKTRTAITGAESAGEPYTAVMPASLRGNFRKEQEKWTDQTLPSNLISYNALAQAVPDDNPGTVIFDEAHRLRNPDSLQTQHAFELSDKANRTYLLSGSPVVNHPHDLAPLMRMVTGNPITPEEFDNKFVGERTISPGLWGWLQGADSVTQPAMVNQDQFADAWKGHVSYHAPAKPAVDQNDEHYNVPMSTDQHRLYNAFWDKLPTLLRWKLQTSFPLSHAELLKLNSFLSGPRQVSLSTFPFMRGQGDAFQAYQQSPKLQKAVGFMQEAHKDPNFRGVAYSNFVNAGLMPYAAALTNAGIPHGIFHGGLNDATRKKVVDDYNAGRTRVLLLGPSGGEGISLKGTRMLQVLDPHWNSTRTTQAIGRGVRFDSHVDLPEDQRNVRVQHFNSELPPGMWQQLWNWVTNAKPKPPELATPSMNPGVDTYLQQMALRKDRLNQEFLDQLKAIGSAK